MLMVNDVSTNKTPGRSAFWPIIFLLLFPAVYAEAIASANTPAVKLLNPVAFILLALVYGLAALLLRDLWVRRRLSWWQALMLGGVYAAFNEGIIADTWFKINPLNFTSATAARIHGINWHLVINLIIFHTVFSMLIPIVLSFLAFPAWRERPLLKAWGTSVSLFGIAILAAANSVLSRHGAPIADHNQRTALLLIMIAVTLVALVWPVRELKQSLNLGWSHAKAYGTGLLFGVLFIFSNFGTIHMPIALSLLLSLVLLVSVYWQLRRLAQASDLNDKTVLLLIAGATTPSALLSLTHLAGGNPILVIVFALWLWWLNKRKTNDPSNT